MRAPGVRAAGIPSWKNAVREQQGRHRIGGNCRVTETGIALAQSGSVENGREISSSK